MVLRHLRFKEVERTLWIDALCINQDDVDERTEQVQKMRRIYSLADQVLAWLGEAADGSDEAIPAIEDIAAKLSGRPIATISLQELREIGIQPEAINWTAIWKLCERPYWSRVWIIQELMSYHPNAKHLFGCGKQWLSKSAMQTFWMWLQFLNGISFVLEGGEVLDPARIKGERGNPPAWHMIITGQMFHDTPDGSLDAPWTPQSLPWLLTSTRSFQATDQRDKIYALLGISTSDGELIPDYSKTTEAVLIDYINHSISKEQNLRCLLGNKLRPCMSTGPSWVPDLYGEEAKGMAWGYDPDNWNKFRPAGDSKSLISFDGSMGRLKVKGFRLGVLVDTVGPFLSNIKFAIRMDLGEGSEASQVGVGIYPHLDRFRQFWPHMPAHLQAVLWRTLVLDQDFEAYPDPTTPAPPELGDMFQILLGFRSVPDDDDDFDAPGYHLRARRYCRRLEMSLEQAIYDRCFFWSDTGWMGLGCFGARPGDVAVVLFGGPLCFVLRPCEGETEFKLVGDAYVHGAMRGDWFETQIVQGRPVEEFVLG